MENNKVADGKTKLSKLEKLKKKKQEITAEIRKERNRENAQYRKQQNIEKTKERKADTRRKIIAGALALSHMEKDAEFKAIMDRLLREGIKKNPERELFGLPPLPEVKKD
jgi:murein L,D-transpeptidase YcbB/YkuD